LPDRRSQRHGGPRLFERGRFLDEFEALFSGTLAVPSRCIAIEGPWGSGRTALINAAADVAGRCGCLVLRARGGETERQTPFAVLGRLVESAAALSGADGAVAEQAGQLAALATDSNGEPNDPNLLAARFHRLVLGLRQQAPVLLVVDDADLADPESLAALQYLVRRLEHQQIWLVVSTRLLHPGVGLRPIDGLLTEPDTRQFVLEPLHQASVEAILAGFFEEQPDSRFSAACTEATGGSPFLVKALLPSLLRNSVAPTSESADSVEQVRAPKAAQFVLSRLAQLPPLGPELIQACAVLGDGADPSVARQLADVDAGSAERSADAAESMELLRPGRPFRFTAPMIRWAIYHDIPKARRSELHAAAAHLLDAHGAGDRAVAGHLLATEPVGSADTAERLHRIGRRALAAGDTDLALACLQRALAESPLSDRRGSLELDLAAAEVGVAGRGGSALAHLQRAVDLGGSEGATVVRVGVGLLEGLTEDPDLRAQAVAVLEGLRTELRDVDRDLRMELELALVSALEQPDERIRCLERLSELLGEPGDDSTAVSALARSAVTLHDVLSSPSIGVDDLATALEQLVDVEQLVSPEPMAGWIQTTALLGLLGADRIDTVDNLLHSALARRSPSDPHLVRRRVSALAALSLSWQGSLVAADEECIRGYDAQASAVGEQQALRLTGHIDILVQQGRIDEAQQLADSMEAGRIEPTLLRALSQIELGRLLMAQGTTGAALAMFEAAGDTATRAGITSPALAPWRADAALARAERGEWDEAARLADENLALARAFGAARTTGIALRASAAAAPDLTRRAELLTEAVEVLETSAARLERARALVDLGTTLIDLGRKEEARAALRQGASLASLCGAHQLLEVAGGRLRAAGARPRRLGLVGPESLTPAELRVVRMAAEGLTNQRIADELFVTLKTVEGHLAKAYRKLGVEGRQDLAEALAGQGDGDDGDEGELLRATAG
jgi:DNA-binding CsgD family transcriptional regulator